MSIVTLIPRMDTKVFHTVFFAQTKSFVSIRWVNVTMDMLGHVYVLSTLLFVTIRRVRRIPYSVCNVVNKIQIKVIENGC